MVKVSQAIVPVSKINYRRHRGLIVPTVTSHGEIQVSSCTLKSQDF